MFGESREHNDDVVEETKEGCCPDCGEELLAKVVQDYVEWWGTMVPMPYVESMYCPSCGYVEED